MNFVILVLCSILLTIFFREFTYAYMDYFDIGINYVTRLMDLDFYLTPLVVVTQIASVFMFDRFISRYKGKWRILLNVSVLILSVILFFTFYALVPYGKGIPRQGGFVQFLGYYFFGLEPGRMPDGSW
jgi:hypothetical protein